MATVFLCDNLVFLEVFSWNLCCDFFLWPYHLLWCYFNYNQMYCRYTNDNNSNIAAIKSCPFQMFVNKENWEIILTAFGDACNTSKLRQASISPRVTLHSVHHSDSSRQMPPRIFTSVISERAVNYGELISSLSFAAAEGDYRITSRAEGYGVRRKLAL